MFELLGRRKVGPGDLLSDDGGQQWWPIERSEIFASALPQPVPSTPGAHPYGQQQMPPSPAWYHSTPFAVLSLFFCWPVGLALLWTNRRASVALRLGVTGALVASVALGMAIIGVTASKFGSGMSIPGTGHALESVAAATNADDPGQEVLDVELYHLLSEYKRNEISADEEFKGRRVRTTGSINRIAKDVLDHPYLTLGTGIQFEIPVAQCFLTDSRSAAALSPGQRVTISGRVTGKSMNVLLDKCEVE